MVEKGSWWERRGESLQVKGKIVGGGGRQRKFGGEGGARPQAELGRSVLTCLLPELFQIINIIFTYIHRKL